MRNSSDIFCLKEPKNGENDGTLIFSVKGSSSVKINRRHPTTSDVFQFGRPKTCELISGTSETYEIDQHENQDTKTADIIIDDPSGEPSVSSSNMKRNPLTGDGFESNTETLESIENSIEAPSASVIGETTMEKAAGESTLTSSSMRRNPLTGDGIEDSTPRNSSRKRYNKKPGKWLW